MKGFGGENRLKWEKDKKNGIISSKLGVILVFLGDIHEKQSLKTFKFYQNEGNFLWTPIWHGLCFTYCGVNINK